ncbi:Excitatory amino acid transporter 1 [Blattella germanica]|nr:Excitatory amino acid transporter 1 [Blattella germanica]
MLDWEISHRYTTGMNILGLVVFATTMGVAIAKMAERGKPLLIFFETLGQAMLLITNWVIWISPIGIFFLVAAKVLEMESFAVIVGQLGMYFTTVLLGIFIHGFIVIPIYYVICTRKLPFRFILNMSQALFTAFGTGSSNATLPISMNCLEELNGVDPRVSKFVMPIGATINMDGTALYEAVAAIFIAQVQGMDRFRTMINVLGDSLGAGIVDHLSKDELLKIGPQQVEAVERGDSQNGKVSSEELEWHTTTM